MLTARASSSRRSFLWPLVYPRDVAAPKRIALSDLKPDPANARRHGERNLRMIEDSLREVGAFRSIGIDEDNVIRVGNGTVASALALGMKSVRVVDAEGDELIAVRRSNLTPAQKIRAALFDNRAAELAEWDAAVLETLSPEDTAGIFDPRDDNGATHRGEWFEPSDTAGIREKYGVEIGQTWSVGGHRVACADSSKPEIIATFSHGCETLVFDPPWDGGFAVPLRPKHIIAFSDGGRFGDVVNGLGAPTWVFVWDCVTSWYTPNRPLRRMKLAAWYGPIDDYRFDGAHHGAPGRAHEATNTRGKYDFIPDPRGKHLSDVFQRAITEAHTGFNHRHEKPIDWVRMLIGNCTQGDIFDPFAGSGSTLFAAEQLGRRANLIDVDPTAVAAIIHRASVNGIHVERVT